MEDGRETHGEDVEEDAAHVVAVALVVGVVHVAVVVQVRARAVRVVRLEVRVVPEAVVRRERALHRCCGAVAAESEVPRDRRGHEQLVRLERALERERVRVGVRGARGVGGDVDEGRGDVPRRRSASCVGECVGRASEETCNFCEVAAGRDQRMTSVVAGMRSEREIKMPKM